jgi:N-hydroxyarylamine O-acetyltransferase
MDIKQYLKRINFTDSLAISDVTLQALHEHHVQNVPFENIDIHYKKLFDLELDNIYKKVILNKRGGFCYELNAIFNTLLCDIGYKSSIIAARIFDDLGHLGPQFDHMCIVVDTGKKYLVDVGYGDLFTKPLEIIEEIQSDGRNLFKIESIDDQSYLLSMCSDHINFYKKYMFNLSAVKISDFDNICFDKQTNPSSYFVRNTLCTRATSNGRLTIFNNKLIEKKGADRTEKIILDDEDFLATLNKLFEIDLE